MLNCIDPHGLVNPIYVYITDTVFKQFIDCSDTDIFGIIYVDEEPTCSYIDSQEKNICYNFTITNLQKTKPNHKTQVKLINSRDFGE